MQEIVTIDCSSVAGEYADLKDADMSDFAKEFTDAMTGIGFAYLVNHGVDMNILEEIHRKTKKFFNLPQETKDKYRKEDPAEDFHGYSRPGDELLNETQKNSTELREFFDIWGPRAFDTDYFPSEVPGLKEDFDSLRKQCVNLAKKLLRCLGIYLKLEDEEYFIKNHSWMDSPGYKKTQTQFRSLYYYPLDRNCLSDIPPNAIRCGEHSDWGTITLLFQDMIGGLEVKRTNGEWVPATPVKDSILINTGQLLERWSAGHFPATPHRVRITDEERLLTHARQSCIFFINPDAEVEVKPIVEPPSQKEEFAKLPSVFAFEHYQNLIKNSKNY